MELKLKFNEELCLHCPTIDCLTNCQYIHLDHDTARKEIINVVRGKESDILYSCLNCYSCEEYCKRGNHPLYLIAERQEEFGILKAPRPIIKRWIQLGEFTGKEPEIKSIGEIAISACFIPMILKLIRGELFKGLPIIYGRHIFCNIVYLHFGTPSVMKQRIPIIINNIAKYGVKELICFHDECYGLFKSVAPAYGLDVPFKPIHLFEYLYNKLRQYESKIKSLNFKVAYQRPCSSKLTPNKEHFVDDIFDLIGVKRVKRKYDYENAVCCGGIIKELGHYKLYKELQIKNVEDMKRAGAEYCVFNCPMCFLYLAEKVASVGITPIMMSELCRLAIGEEPVEYRVLLGIR